MIITILDVHFSVQMLDYWIDLSFSSKFKCRMSMKETVSNTRLTHFFNHWSVSHRALSHIAIFLYLIFGFGFQRSILKDSKKCNRPEIIQNFFFFWACPRGVAGALKGLPLPSPMYRQNDRQTQLKTLPSSNFIAGR